MRTHYVIGTDGAIDPADRGLAYGDGLFETMAVRGGVVLRLDMHLDRLRSGCARLAIDAPDLHELRQKIDSAVADTGRGTLKLILTRGSGPRGYTPPASPVLTVAIQAIADKSPIAAAIAVVTLDERLAENEKLAGIKHLCRLEQVLGRLELKDRVADEGLMLSTSGDVIGGTSRNLFAVIGQRIVTPDLSRAGIAGVMRRAVLEQAETLGIESEVRAMRLNEISQADEIFMTNALVGIQTVARFDGVPVGSRGMAGRLSAALESEPGNSPSRAGSSDA